MTTNRVTWLLKFKSIEKSQALARLSLERLRRDVQRDPTLLGPGMRPREIDEALDTLEETYFVRLFALFETGLRLYWRSSVSASRPTTYQLLQRVATHRAIPNDIQEQTQAARVYRNALVHAHIEHFPISIKKGRSWLSKYFSYLPETW